GGGGFGGRDGGVAGDGGQVLVALLGPGLSLALAGLVVQRRAPGPGGQVGAGGEPVHVRAGFSEGVLGGASAPPGHGFGLLQLFLMGGQQPLDYLGEFGDLGVELVNAAQHGGQQRGVLGGEELRSFQRFFYFG